MRITEAGKTVCSTRNSSALCFVKLTRSMGVRETNSSNKGQLEHQEYEVKGKRETVCCYSK